jgi:hypothetical protein
MREVVLQAIGFVRDSAAPEHQLGAVIGRTGMMRYDSVVRMNGDPTLDVMQSPRFQARVVHSQHPCLTQSFDPLGTCWWVFNCCHVCTGSGIAVEQSQKLLPAARPGFMSLMMTSSTQHRGGCNTLSVQRICLPKPSAGGWWLHRRILCVLDPKALCPYALSCTLARRPSQVRTHHFSPCPCCAIRACPRHAVPSRE